MKLTRLNYESTLAAVRFISETATTKPAPRKLATVRVRSPIIRDVPVHQPWIKGQSFWDMS